MGFNDIFPVTDGIILLGFWVKILQCMEYRNPFLQSIAISLDIQASNIQALVEEMISLHDSWQCLLSAATVVAEGTGIDPKQAAKEKAFFLLL